MFFDGCMEWLTSSTRHFEIYILHKRQSKTVQQLLSYTSRSLTALTILSPSTAAVQRTVSPLEGRKEE